MCEDLREVSSSRASRLQKQTFFGNGIEQQQIRTVVDSPRADCFSDEIYGIHIYDYTNAGQQYRCLHAVALLMNCNRDAAASDLLKETLRGHGCFGTEDPRRVDFMTRQHLPNDGKRHTCIK